MNSAGYAIVTYLERRYTAKRTRLITSETQNPAAVAALLFVGEFIDSSDNSQTDLGVPNKL